MKKLGILGLVVVGYFCLLSINNACSAPVVLESRTGEVCGCITDGDVPTLDQCDDVDRSELHEVIVVSKC